MDFDENRWQEAIKKPDWYLEFGEYAKKIKLKDVPETKAHAELKKKVRNFFENALEQGQINLGGDGYNFDNERQQIDTVVIHHTSAKPGYELSYLNAVQLLNIYVPAYVHGKERGQPIWSGHFYKGRQVFWGYHWLMRMDGSFEKLLNDNQIGWHAGDWEINKRSIGICIDNDYDGKDPTEEILQKLAIHIREKYPRTKLIGHCEARKGTTCPGKNFLDGWRQDLLSYLHDTQKG
jgi:hypothetical protein